MLGGKNRSTVSGGGGATSGFTQSDLHQPLSVQSDDGGGLLRGRSSTSGVFAGATTTPSGQSDFYLLAELADSIRDESRRVAINTAQTANLARRLLSIADMLAKLPDPRPTPQLLAVFQSADYLIKGMSHAPAWENVLRERFLCQDRFAGLRDRLRGVWRLHPTTHWEDQDRRAGLADEKQNAAVLLRLTLRDDPRRPLRVVDLTGPALLTMGGHPPMRREDRRSGSGSRAPPNHHHRSSSSGGSSDGARADGELLPSPSAELISGEALSTLQRNSSSVYVAAAGTQPDNNSSSSAFLAASSATGGVVIDSDLATEDDVVAFYRRRHLSSWKLLYEDLDRLTDPAEVLVNYTPSAAYQPPVVALTNVVPSSRHGPTGTAPAAVAPRFTVSRGFLFHGHPVVVKELTDSTERPLSPHTITSFVQDAVARSRWCHPGLVRYHGAYTEKFLTGSQETCNWQVARERGLPVFSLLPSVATLMAAGSGADEQQQQQQPLGASGALCTFSQNNKQSDSAGKLHHRASQTAYSISATAAAAQRLPPRLALGFIMEDASFSADGLPTLPSDGGAEAGGQNPLSHTGPFGGANTTNTGDVTATATTRAMTREEREVATAGSSSNGSSRTMSPLAPPQLQPQCVQYRQLPEYVCLHELLFAERMRFSLLDSIDVVLQLGEALQYLLLDQPNVPEEVVTAWLSIAPSNVFVAPVPPPPHAQGRLGDVLGGAGGTGHAHARVASTGSGAAANPLFRLPPLPLRDPAQRPTGLVVVREVGGVSPSAGEDEAADNSSSSGQWSCRNSSVVFAPYNGSRSHHIQQQRGGSQHSPTPSPGLASVSGNASMTASPSPFTFTVPFPMPYYTLALASAAATGFGDRYSNRLSDDDDGGGVLCVATSQIPQLLRGAVAVKYAPPAFIEEGPFSRWRPHPRAVSPACYALAHLLLALLTGQPPHRRARSQRELQERVFGPALSSSPFSGGGGGVDADAVAANSGGWFKGSGGGGVDEDGLPSVRTGGPAQGFAVPNGLPLSLRVLLRLALSVCPLTSDEYRAETYAQMLSSSNPNNSSLAATATTTTTAAAMATAPATPTPRDWTDDREMEDCAYLLSRLQASSSNVATNGSATFADSSVSAVPVASAAAAAMAPRALSLPMFMEGLAVVAAQMIGRGVSRHDRLDLAADPVYSRFMDTPSGGAQPRPGTAASASSAPRYVDPMMVEVPMMGSDAVLDDYGEN